MQLDKQFGLEDPTSEHIMRHGGQVNWINVEKAVEHVAYVMAYNHYKPAAIVGIARGGLVPAVMLSHRLDIPYVEAGIDLQLRDGSKTATNHKRQDQWDSQQVLFIDDLWDTGKTMEFVGEAYPKALRATLFYKGREPRNIPPINFPGFWIPQELWLSFPWEISLKDQSRERAAFRV